MSLGEQLPTVTASGSVVAFTGAVVAGTSSADVGNAAIIVAMGGLVTGILGGITQLVKLILDSKGYAGKIGELEGDLAATKQELAGSRQRRHQDANRFNGILMELQAKNLLAERKANEAAIRVARLEGQLSTTDKAHSEAINANSDNIIAVAAKTDTELPAPVPHVEPIGPIVPDTDDEITPFAPRFSDNNGPDRGLDR